MSSILIVLIDGRADERLLQTAKAFAKGADVEINICNFVDEKRYQSDVEQSAKAGEDIESLGEMETKAKGVADDIGEAMLSDEVQYVPHGIVGSVPNDVLRTAEELGCDHVFVTGKRRSPTGKVLFGDDAQKIILSFDGPVTVTTEPA